MPVDPPSSRPRPVKLIVQIPCLNEAATLPLVLADLPRTIPGVDVIETLVVDDGSTDGTAEVARSCGVDHVVRFPKRRGLARAFAAGLEACLARGADVIVNTDADNQYRGADATRLVEPILTGRADVVIGARPIAETPHFSPTKKLLQRLGSWVVRRASGTDVPDAPSGFRAFSREAASRLYVLDDYTYTLETLIRAARGGLTIESVPIRTNAPLRPSRLIRSSLEYVWRSAAAIVRTSVACRPLVLLATPGVIGVAAGLALAVWLAASAWLSADASATPAFGPLGVLAGALTLAGIGLIAAGVVADLVAMNRKLLERLDARLQRLEDARSDAESAERDDARDEDRPELDALSVDLALHTPIVSWRRKAG